MGDHPRHAQDRLPRRDAAGRHPRSPEWEHCLGQLIPGETCGQQLTIAHQRYVADQRTHADAIPVVAWGTRPATEIERAIGARVTSPDWPQQLASALEAFRNLRWPRKFLLKPRPASTATRALLP